MAAQEKNMQEIEKAKKLNHVPWGEEYEKMISGMLYVYHVFSIQSACSYSMKHKTHTPHIHYISQRQVPHFQHLINVFTNKLFYSFPHTATTLTTTTTTNLP